MRAYLDTLTWDGECRLAHWLRTAFGITRPDHLRMGELWMISAVRRVYEPGRAVHAILGIAGPQGIGKSRVLALLGGPFYSPSYNDPAPREGVWIQELNDLRDDMKAVVFARHGRPQTSYALTTNSRVSVPASRRLRWVTCVQQLDEAAIRGQRDQLWAEARLRLSFALQCEARERSEAVEPRRSCV